MIHLNLRSFVRLGAVSFIFLGGISVDLHSQIVIDRRVTVQPILLSNGTTVNNQALNFFEAEADKIWSQANIDIHFLSPVIYTNTSFFNNINSGSGSSSLNTLSTTIGNGASEDPSVINLWFTTQIGGSSANLGLTLQSTPGDGFTVARNGIAIANSTFSMNAGNVIAHEIGHSLGLDHSTFGATGQFNLMSQTTIPGGGIGVNDIYPNGADYGQLTSAQITQARSVNQFVIPYSGVYVPEPSSAIPVAGALAAFAYFFRRHRLSRVTSGA